MKRSVITIEDLSKTEIEAIFDLADEYMSKLPDPQSDFRVRGRLNVGSPFVAATLFYEPSTRTKFSFETAMVRLGGHFLSAADPAVTSAAKGETLADTVRVIQNYADIIVLRHPAEGAARLAAQYAEVPIINAGDGGHEHPTQTLCDLYTLRREKTSLAGLNVLLCGDLKNGRTIHSLVYALARFGANIFPLPAPGLELPDHVARRLEWEYGCIPQKVKGKKGISDLAVDVVYVTPHEPHQQALFPDVKVDVRVALERKALSTSRIDVCYVTRLQKERLPNGKAKNSNYPVVDQHFLQGSRFEHTHVLHPLPRVIELGYDLDEDPRGAYFKQAAYGVPIRMALIASLLRICPDVLQQEGSEGKYDRFYARQEGIKCPNMRCITRVDSEKSYLKPKFWIVNRNQLPLIQSEMPLTARCYFCEYDIVPLVVGDAAKREYYSDCQRWSSISPNDLILFVDEEQAEAQDRKSTR